MRLRSSVLAWMLVSGVGADGPRSPSESARAMRLADPELVVELVVAEPAVESPVAVAWDEAGRMYVAEMSDYPVGPGNGRIKRLEPDGRGGWTKPTVFADGLPFPNSVLPYDDGVLVTAAPDLWFLRDRDGDGRADEKRMVLTGFGAGNQQLRANGLLWGIDNWVYGANGRSDGDLRPPALPATAAVSIRRRDFRFRPNTNPAQVEAVAGFSQFGLAQDDWGNRYPSWNTQPLRQIVIEERHLARHPRLASAATTANIAPAGDSGRLYPLAPAAHRFNRESVQFFNASCGNAVYRGDALGDDYRGNLFVCEPLGNLVHRRRLETAGIVQVATTADFNREFLASTDPWFHPVLLATGPDGAFYVVDFYREWVEHPEYVPKDQRQQVDWRRGADHGRIWRVRRRDRAPTPPASLDELPAEQLVGELGHPNGWRRDTAQRLLVERRALDAIGRLRDLIRTGPPLAQLHGLWTLDGLTSLDEPTLLAAIASSSPGVRRHAVRLASGRRSAAGLSAVRTAAADADGRVRFEAVLAIGSAAAEKTPALIQAATRDGDDPWFRLAILSGASGIEARLLRHFLQAKTDSVSSGFLADAAALAGASLSDREVRELANACLAGAFNGRSLATIAGLAEGVARRGSSLRSILTASAPDRLKDLETRLMVLSESPHAVANARAEAIRVAARLRLEHLGARLPTMLANSQPEEVRLAAAWAVGELGDPAVAKRVLAEASAVTGPPRRELLASLVRARRLAEPVIESLEQGRFALAELDAGARAALERLPDPSLRGRAAKLFARVSSRRAMVVEKYQSALKQAGDPRVGETLFVKHCAACHRLGTAGRAVGPDLGSVVGRPPATLLEDILDPSKEVAPDYLAYAVVTRDGQVLSGLLANETAGILVLRRAEGVEDRIFRDQIEDLRVGQKSLMPEGFEQQLSVAEMADLLTYLRLPK